MHLLMHLFVYVFTSRGLYLEEWGQNSTSSEEYSVSGECRLQKCHSTYRCVILSKLVKVLDKIFTCDKLKDKNLYSNKFAHPVMQRLALFPCSMQHEATGSIIAPLWPGCQFIVRLPPPPHFVRLPTIRRYLFILLCRVFFGESNVFCPRKQHIDPASSRAQTSQPLGRCLSRRQLKGEVHCV